MLLGYWDVDSGRALDKTGIAQQTCSGPVISQPAAIVVQDLIVDEFN